MFVKITPRTERKTIGSPNNKLGTHEPYRNGAKTNIIPKPHSKIKLAPIIDNLKLFLLIENIPPSKPDTKPRMPKIPTKKYV
jgi:hypothetical protein